MIPTCTWVSAPLIFPPFSIAIEQGSGKQDLLLKDLCSLRLAGGLTACGCEVVYEDEAPDWIPPREAAHTLPRVREGLRYPDPTGLLCSSTAALTFARTCPAHRLELWGDGRSPRRRPARRGLPRRFPSTARNRVGREGKGGCLVCWGPMRDTALGRRIAGA